MLLALWRKNVCSHKKGIVLIIKPIKKALLYEAGIIEFAMILFYINASTLKEILIEFGISLVVIFLVILLTGETVILDEKGCCLVWFNGLLKKKYKWEQLKSCIDREFKSQANKTAFKKSNTFKKTLDLEFTH